MNDLISIIVPVYNVEKYVEKCIISLINQTYKNIQIILVDDGSTDRSAEICDKYSREYQYIEVVHKTNGGQAEARNVGLEKSLGDWIAFIDSDDWIEPNFCEDLLKAALKHNADIAMCKTCLVNENGDKILNGKDTEECIEYTYNEIIEGLISQDKIRFELWNKLWSRNVINNERFIIGQISEEVHFDRVVFPRACNFVFINKTLHNYLISRPGNTKSSYKKNRDCVFAEFDAWSSELRDAGMCVSADTIEKLALNFAIIIYYEALFSKANKSELVRLKKIYNNYFDKIRRSRNVRNWLFYIFPVVYCLLIRFKSVMRKNE